jgi:hypothetical protein
MHGDGYHARHGLRFPVAQNVCTACALSHLLKAGQCSASGRHYWKRELKRRPLGAAKVPKGGANILGTTEICFLAKTKNEDFLLLPKRIIPKKWK